MILKLDITALPFPEYIHSQNQLEGLSIIDNREIYILEKGLEMTKTITFSKLGRLLINSEIFSNEYYFRIDDTYHIIPCVYIYGNANPRLKIEGDCVIELHEEAKPIIKVFGNTNLIIKAYGYCKPCIMSYDLTKVNVLAHSNIQAYLKAWDMSKIYYWER